MPMAAKTQNVDRAGRAEVAPSAKAKRSVREVIVMETPAEPIALAIRSLTGRSVGCASSAAVSTNISSTPIPIRTNGRT